MFRSLIPLVLYCAAPAVLLYTIGLVVSHAWPAAIVVPAVIAFVVLIMSGWLAARVISE